MSDYLFLKLNNKEVSIKPEFAPVNPDSLVQSNKTITIPMVSNDSSNVQKGDTVEFSTKNTEQTPAVKAEEQSWYEALGNSIVQGSKFVVIKANKYIDSEAVHESILGWDLDDDNRIAAADANAVSETDRVRKFAAIHVSRMENAKRQGEFALKQIAECDEVVREGYAEQYHNFKPENQALTAGALAFQAKSTSTVEKVISNSKNCAVKVQAEVTGAIADGIVKNNTFDEPQKTDMGVKLAKNVVNLDETQQASAYEQVANKMNAYKKVVDEVQYQVVNVAKENVRKEAIAKLQTSSYENVKQTFSAEAVKKAQEAFKAANGGKITAEQAKEIKKAVEADLNTAVKEGKIEAQKQIAQAKKAEQVAETDSKSFAKKLGFKAVTSKTDDKKDIKYSDFTTRRQYLAAKYELEECKTLGDFAKSVKDMSKTDLKHVLKSVSTKTKEEMFKDTTSVYLQSFLLKNGDVKYEDVKNQCLTGVNSQLKVFTLNNDIEYAIQRLNG